MGGKISQDRDADVSVILSSAHGLMEMILPSRMW